MRCVLSPVGTLGDIRPMIVLGKALQEAGHHVEFVSPLDSRQLVDRHGLTYRPLDIDFRKLMEGWEGRSSTTRRQLLPHLVKVEMKVLPDVCQGADVLIGGSLLMTGYSVAEAVGIPYFQVVYTLPVLPSAAYPAIVISQQNLPGWLNRWTWRVMIGLVGWLGTAPINRARKQLGLRPINNHYREKFKHHVIVTVDRALASVPADVTSQYVQTDYWHLDDEDASLDHELTAFIENGTCPIYVGFGSMPRSRHDRTEKALAELLDKTDRRLVLARGWAGLGNQWNHQRVQVIDHAPHHLLFPRMAAVIHHGGSGTVHTAARAGVPQIIVPTTMDQPWWGAHLHRLGLAPAPLKKSKLTGDRLLHAIQEATSERIRSTAQAKGMELRTHRQDVREMFGHLLSP